MWNAQSKERMPQSYT